MYRSGWPSHVAGCAAMLATIACKPAPARTSTERTPSTPLSQSERREHEGSRLSLEPLPADPDPCGYISPEEVSTLVGELTEPPRRGTTFDHPEAAKSGKACVYTVKAGGRSDRAPTLSVQVRTDAVQHEVGF